MSISLNAVSGYLQYRENAPNKFTLDYELNHLFFEAHSWPREHVNAAIQNYLSTPTFPSPDEIKYLSQSTRIAPEVIVLGRLNHLNVKLLGLSAYFMLNDARLGKHATEQQTLRRRENMLDAYQLSHYLLKNAWDNVNSRFTLEALRHAERYAIDSIVQEAASIETQAGIVFGAYIASQNNPMLIL